ncbi:MAG: hypothetical protein ACFE85_08640 [Candidatus Hodarchaeota archaeon]
MSSGRIAKNTYIDINGNINLNYYQRFETTDKNQIYSFNQEFPIINNNSLLRAIEIHDLLLNTENLTNNEKLDYCQIGRHFIKLFLKEIVKKYENL